MKGERLDNLVIARGLLPSREVARTAIMDGGVLVNGEKATKPGMLVPVDCRIDLAAGFNARKFVSRGGLKLEKALVEFSISAAGPASTLVPLQAVSPTVCSGAVLQKYTQSM